MSHDVCTDCNTRIAPGDPVHRVAEGIVCQPCVELREMAFGTLASRRESTANVRRGPRHLVPADVAARITMSRSDGTAGPAEPILEISRHGFRVGAMRLHEVGQRLQCAAVVPGRVAMPAQFDVEVRWCRRERADRFEIGVEVSAADADRYAGLYQTLLTAIGHA